MTVPAIVALGAATLLAVGDWVAVARRDKRLEYVCKPGVMVALAAVALAVESDRSTGRRAWIIVALLCSLAGDVFLMLPTDRFIEGLGSFLAGHLAYIVAFSHGGEGWDGVLQPRTLVLLAVVPVLVRVAGAAAAQDRALGAAVAVYGAVILAMAVSAWASGSWVAAVGAVLFMASDALIGWSRFVDPALRRAPMAIIVTYHVAQAALVLSLVA